VKKRETAGNRRREWPIKGGVPLIGESRYSGSNLRGIDNIFGLLTQRTWESYSFIAMNDAKLFAVTFYQFEVDLGVIKYRSRAAGPLTVPHFINISPILHKTMSTASPPAPIVTFKKAPRRPQASRKRSTSPSLSSPNIASSSTSESNVIRPTKKSLVNPLIQGTKRRRDPTEENAGLDEMEYRADEGLIGGRADVYATRSTDYDLDSGVALDEAGRRELGEKKVRLNEVCHLPLLIMQMLTDPSAPPNPLHADLELC